MPQDDLALLLLDGLLIGSSVRHYAVPTANQIRTY
jgi:hypothetical protein